MNKIIYVIYKGKDDPLALRNGKIYKAIIGQKGMYCIADETGEEYAYNPSLFDVISYNESNVPAREDRTGTNENTLQKEIETA